MSHETLPKLENYNSDQSIISTQLGRFALEQLYYKDQLPIPMFTNKIYMQQFVL